MTRKFVLLVAALPVSCLLFMVGRANERSHKIDLPTSKTLTVPVPGFIARTNSFPATIAVSPDGRYAALLNQGYGTEQSGVRQSIAILDLSNNQSVSYTHLPRVMAASGACLYSRRPYQRLLVG